MSESFEELLHKKLIGKSPTQQKSMRCYYRKMYKKTGQIPEALLYENSKKLCGKKKFVDAVIAERFAEMVKASADDDISSPGFVPRRLRKISNFHEVLEKEFGKKIPIYPIYRLAKERNLHEYLNKPDFEDEKFRACGKNHFRSVPVFDLIQVDGCMAKYLKIKNEKEEFDAPVIISFFDTGSRFIFNMNLCFSESNQSAAESFCQFLRSTEFPKKKIRFRPDNGTAFLGLKRPISELNMKYSTVNGMEFESDFARVLKAKDKVHLERSHRTLHNFEFFVIQEFADRIIERTEGTKFFSGKIEKTVMTHLNITLEELKASGIMEKYREKHNSTSHIFTDDGYRSRRCPKEKLEQYLAESETVGISENDISAMNVYGFQRDLISSPKSRNFVYHGRQYFIFREVSNFYKLKNFDKVRVSADGDQLHIFEDKDDGIFILTAFATQAPVKTEHTENVAEPDVRQKKRNQHDLIIALSETKGMVVSKNRLFQEFRNGLTLEIAMELVQEHDDKYRKYYGEKGFIAFNLFLADFLNHRKPEVKPCADLRRVA